MHFDLVAVLRILQNILEINLNVDYLKVDDQVDQLLMLLEVELALDVLLADVDNQLLIEFVLGNIIFIVFLHQ